MKKQTTGILLLCLMVFAAGVGYASNAPKIEKASQEVSQKASKEVASFEAPVIDYKLLAQNEAPATEATEAAPATEATPAPPSFEEQSKADKAAAQVLEIASALDIKVDTAASPTEIYQDVLQQAQGIPKKGSGAAAWISWILACLGIGGSIFFFVKNQKLKKGG